MQSNTGVRCQVQ